MQGVFITIEGVEGSGKSTQILRLSERLRRLGLPLVVSKEPGGTALGREVRRLLLEPHPSGETWCPDSELLLFYADRAQHLERVIRPALAGGNIVLVDRFEDSTRAYQGASGVPDSALDRLGDLVLRGLRPHLTLLLDMDPEVSLQRVEVRNLAMGSEFAETRFDDAELAFRTDDHAEKIKAGRIKRVRSDIDNRAIDQNHAHAQDVVRRDAIFEAMRAA